MKRRNFLQWLGLAVVLNGCGSQDAAPLGTGNSLSVPAGGGSAGFVPPLLARLDQDAVPAFGANGNLYQAFPRTSEIRCSDSNGRVIWSYLQRGLTTGKLNQPVALTVDAQGRTWVADSGLGKLVVLDANGAYLFESAPGVLNLPQDLVISGQKVFVSDANHHRVAVFDLNGALLTAFGNGRLNYPRGLALDANGNLHVVDSGANKLFVFAQDGSFLQSYGGPGKGAGLFQSCRGIAIRPQDGLVAIADLVGGSLEYFSSSLQSLGEVPNPGLQVRDLQFAPNGSLYLFYDPGRKV
ncbi:NHL repeat-containing protein [bacterium]|nr:NHL repeat-containing protein [bacterium]